MGQYHEIKLQKGLTDLNRSRVFTRHATLITIAARKGGDPSINPTLRLAIDNAKKDNVPNANIDRAIKRGTGELKEAAEIHEVTYEGYGPEGIAVIVEGVTDNKNRTVTHVRTVFDKYGGKLGSSGSVAWMFDRKGAIEVNIEGKNPDEIEIAAIDAGAEDLKIKKGIMEIYTQPGELHEAQQQLEKNGIVPQKAGIKWIPKETLKINNREAAERILDFMEALEEDADVSQVTSNFDIPEEILKAIND